MSRVETTIANRPEAIEEVWRLIDGLAAAHGLAADVVADLNVALDEVLTNIITHGYTDEGQHEIRVRLSVDAQAVVAEIEDDARPFDPLAVPPPDLSGPLLARAPGGLGIHFVRRLMSRVAYSYVDNKNRLVLERRLAPPAEDDVDGAA